MQNSHNDLSVICPSCEATIEVNEILHAQIKKSVESDFQAQAKANKREMAELRQNVAAEKSKLQASKESFAELVSQEVKKREAVIVASAAEKARKDQQHELVSHQTKISKMSAQIQAFRESELGLLNEKQALETAKAEIELKVARQLNEDRSKLIEQAKDQFKQEFDLKQAEKDKQIEDMLKKIHDLKRQAEQGSQQLQGEVQELALENMLETTFRRDVIEPIKTGVRGADTLQKVTNDQGRECGSILWESKRTKAWQNTWLEKLRDDQRNAKSACAVLVTEAMPPGISNFAFRDGIWICSWSCVVGLASALRYGLIETAKVGFASEGRTEKIELVYQYLAGQEFQQRVSAIVESYSAMQADLVKEKRSMNAIWNKRSKQLERAIQSTSGLYGDLQGIIGTTLPVLPELSLKKIADERAA